MSESARSAPGSPVPGSPAADVAVTLEEIGGWPAVIATLLDRHDLPTAHARAGMKDILDGSATAAQLIGFVVALRAKGETPEEISGLLDAVLAAATLVPLDESTRDRAVDIVGTGGDRSHSINISTMASFVVAGAGVPVCKHGARAASSKCGTADVLEALGVAIELSPLGVKHCIETAGMGFCFAPRYHPAFRFAAQARRDIGVATVFNLLGPMANPGRVRRQVIGVANPAVAERMLASLRLHGSLA
ncbi:MAG: anthranilate phosphoribosyltransferase, partial [Actinomycetota bacterium]